MGAPEGNANRLTTGDRSALLLPQLGKALGPIGKVGRKYRRTLESLVLSAKSEVAADDAHSINAAARYEMIVLACARRLRLKGETLDDAAWVGLMDRMGKFTQQRNAAVKELRLGHVKAPDLWAGVFDAPPSHATTAANGSQHDHAAGAPQAKPSDCGGPTE